MTRRIAATTRDTAARPLLEATRVEADTLPTSIRTTTVAGTTPTPPRVLRAAAPRFIPRRDPAELAEAAAREAREERLWREAYRRRTAEKSPLVRVGRRYRGGQRRARAPRGRAQARSDRRDPEAREARLREVRDLGRPAPDREYADSIQREFAADRRRALSRSMRSGGGRYDDTVDGALDWLFTPLVKTTRDIGEWLNEDLETTRGYGAEEWARRSLPPPSSRAPPGRETNGRGQWTDDRYYGYDDGRFVDEMRSSDDRLRGDRRLRLRGTIDAASARSRVRPSRTMTSTTARGLTAAGAGTSTPSDRRIPSIRVRVLAAATATGRARARAAAADGAPEGVWGRDDPDAPITAEEFHRLRDERTW